ncbi:MAG: hypothetical protein H6552_07050 [Chitinophagales bacterium]|nr:hypothetical protein [Chitinophagales bacterium]
MPLIRNILFILAVIISGYTYSQAIKDVSQLSNLRIKYFAATDNNFSLDTNFVFPNSIVIRNINGILLSPETDYQYDMNTGNILINSSVTDSFYVTYRIFNTNLPTNFTHKKFQSSYYIDSLDVFFKQYQKYQPKQINQIDFLDFGGLQYSGNFSRGVQFGSNQDLSLNSNLDLRLSGKIGNDIEIIAALSDQNIPLQPDGTTQQLQDFDKIYIQINKEPHRIIAGDFNQKSSNNSYFLRFSKQLQGISYANSFKFKKNMQLNTNTAFAVARGKFARNTFYGQEGNQGPYRLLGNNNESYIIILAGSEKVYINGNLLTRGETNDYIIDYNSGEIIFMPRFLITKDSRIVVEFEYSDKNYFRTTIHNAIDFKYKNFKIYTEVYSEQDAKNKPILNDLNDSAKTFLASIGNNISNAFFDGFKPTNYDETTIQYRLIDTTIGLNHYDTVFIYAPTNNGNLYKVNFSFVGTNKGNYKTSKNSNNLRVYEWVPPIDGMPQGSYEPVILLVTPKTQLMTVSGMQYDYKNMNIKSEFAFSQKDMNTFSDIDNKASKGYATNLELGRNDTIKNNNNQLKTTIKYEFKQANFRQIEPYRNTEFTRDWNLNDINSNFNEHLIGFQETYNNSKINLKASYRFTSLIRQKNYQGFESQIPITWNYKNIELNADFKHLSTKDTTLSTSFFRPNIQMAYAIQKAKGLKFGINYLQENNRIQNIIADTLSNNSFKFNIAGLNISLPDSNKWSFNLDYKFRNDFNGLNNQMHIQSFANLIDFKGSANAIKNQHLNWSFTYRDLKVLDSVLAKTPSERTYLGRIEYGNRFFKTALRSNFIYELGGGQERIRQFTYLQVQSGQGYYKWIDENQNGIKELNEFVQSQFSDSAQYIKVYTDLNEYIRAYTTSYTQTINLTPKAVWFNESGIKKFISKFQIVSFLNISRKTLKDKHVKPFNPFIMNSKDSNIVNLNSNIRNTIAFNTGDPTYYVAYSNQILNEKLLLVNGYDTRKKVEHLIDGYYNIKTAYTLNYKLLFSKQSYISDFFSNNNLHLNIYVVEPKFSYNFKTMIRTSLSYGFLYKQNSPQFGNEKMISNKLETEFRYSKAGKNTLTTKFSLILVNYNSETASTKSYTILEGLQKGKNYIWNMEYSRFIGSNLELLLVYEGRKTGTAKVVNTGRAQLRAIF